MKHRKVISAIFSVLMLCSLVPSALASQTENNDYCGSLVLDEDGNYEYIGEVNFSDVDLSVINGSQIVVTPSKATTRVNPDATTVKDVYAFFDKYPDIERCIADKITNGEETIAISYTDVPLKWVADHYERISSSDHFSSDASKGADGNFLLYATLDYDRSFSEADGTITRYYTVKTYGTWAKNSAASGEKYPAAGYDYVHQTVPNEFTIEKTKFSCRYDNGDSGTSSDYSEQDGGDCFTEYRVKDDPVGNKQLKSFTLTSNVYAPASSSKRLAHSYYTHTWKSLSISTTVSVSTAKEVQLSITPSIQEKSWTIHNRLSFTM